MACDFISPTSPLLLPHHTSEEKDDGMAASPPTLPFLGNLHQLGHRGNPLHHNMAKLAALHGRLMTIFVGSWQPTIVVSDGELAREVLVTKSGLFADRSPPPAVRPVSADFRTVSTSGAGTHWHGLRRGLQAGPLGPANLAAQFKYMEEDMEEMIRSMEGEAKKNGGVVQPLAHIRRASLRLLTRLCFGADFADDALMAGTTELLPSCATKPEPARGGDTRGVVRGHLAGVGQHLFHRRLGHGLLGSPSRCSAKINVRGAGVILPRNDVEGDGSEQAPVFAGGSEGDDEDEADSSSGSGPQGYRRHRDFG